MMSDGLCGPSRMPDQFCRIIARATEKGGEIYEAEEELIGTSHAGMGAYLLSVWGMPHLAVEAVAHHHRPTRIPHSGFDTSIAIYVANLLANEQYSATAANPELREADRLSLCTFIGNSPINF
jgi:HD-like signal output (HDOD) protein